MSLYISVSKTSKHFEAIKAMADELDCPISYEEAPPSGLTKDMIEKPVIGVMRHSKALYEHILALEPTVEERKKEKTKRSSHLTLPTSEDVVKYGYED